MRTGKLELAFVFVWADGVASDECRCGPSVGDPTNKVMTRGRHEHITSHTTETHSDGDSVEQSSVLARQ